ncbi:MAG: phenylacetate--CoA ligase family protein, partial [Chloroflexi bacterium]|nr:phenylacetate--CoA ligase family protein [Chloroflexota bacterium]
MTLAAPAAQSERALHALETFVHTSLDDALAGADDERAARQRALELFRDVASSVPAYRDFLRQRDIDPSAIRTIDNFQRLPMVTKDNYLRRHSLAELCREGALERCDMLAVSSGSTGEPTFWPRFLTDELTIARRLEQAFFDSFRADER